MKDSLSSLSLMFACALVASMGTACENPNPLAQVEAIGEYPKWGQGFGKQDPIAKSDESLLNAPNVAKDGTAKGTDGGPAAAKAAPDAATLAMGRTTFLTHCARCHGPEGKGLDLPMVGKTANLQGATILGRTDAELTTVIQNGRGNMPAFGGTLNPKQIGSVLTWIRAGTPKTN